VAGKRFFLFLSILSVLSLLTFANAAGSPKGTYALTAADGAVWELSLDESGKFRATENGKEVVIGKYKVSKDEIEFTDEDGVYAERGDAKTGSYKWKLANNKLAFTNINDKADGRSATLTAGPWEMKK
jgi:hypothetical protein